MKWDQISIYIKALGVLFLRRVVPLAFGLAVLVGLSFLVWGEFSLEALSERLVWTGIGCALVGGVLVFGAMAGGRDYGTPGMFIRSAHVNAIIDWNIEIRKDIEKKFDFTIQSFLAGLLVFLLGVLASKLAG